MLIMRDERFCKTLCYPLKESFGFMFCKPNTWHLICNNFNMNFIYGIVCFYVLCLRILSSLIIPRYDLGRQTPHFWGGSVTVTVDSSASSCSRWSSAYLCMEAIMFSVTKSVSIPVYKESASSIPRRCVWLFSEEAQRFIFKWAQ
jgi:hypothetical protein